MNAKEATQRFAKGEIGREAWLSAARADQDAGRSTPALMLHTRWENSDWDEAELRKRAERIYEP